MVVIQLSKGSSAVTTQVNTNYSLTVAGAKTWSRALLLLWRRNIRNYTGWALLFKSIIKPNWVFFSPPSPNFLLKFFLSFFPFKL